MSITEECALKLMIDYYDPIYHLVGNGCEHGFKPARCCKNKICKERDLNIALDYFMSKSGAKFNDDIGHPRRPEEDRDEIELFLRDAYAAGCNSIAGGQIRSFVTAAQYAAREAPLLRSKLRACGIGARK